MNIVLSSISYCASVRAQYDTLRGTIFTNSHAIAFLLNNLIKKKLLRCANLGHWHCNRAAVSRNRYGVEKTVDTHKILINAITFYVCFQEI
jgi:predicted transcriptional regulator